MQIKIVESEESFYELFGDPLLLCPFCESDDLSTHWLRVDGVLVTSIKCFSCHATGPRHKNESSAEAGWNKAIRREAPLSPEEEMPTSKFDLDFWDGPLDGRVFGGVRMPPQEIGETHGFPKINAMYEIVGAPAVGSESGTLFYAYRGKMLGDEYC